MDNLIDITIHLPSEYLEEFSDVIEMGLQRAKIKPEARKELAAWWNAERELISSS